MVGYYNSFVVRVWSDEQGRLRGRIEHVLTREISSFTDPAAIVEFIRTHLTPPPVQTTDPVSDCRDEGMLPDDGGASQ